MRFEVRLVPRGGRIDGVGESGELRARVRAIPGDGAANAALSRLIADVLGVARGAVTLESGKRGRTKRLHVDGIRAGEVVRRWPGLVVVDAPDGPAG